MEKRKKKSRFWFGFRIYAGVLVLLFVIMCIAVWNTMKKYEAAQPENYMADVVAKIEKGSYGDINIINGGGSRFEPDNGSADEFWEAVAGKKLTYRLSSDSYDSLNPKFDLLADNEKAAVVTLKSVKEYKKMAILVLSEWQVASVEPVGEKGSFSLEITMPEGYEALVNGVELSGEGVSTEVSEYDDFGYASEYVKVPSAVTYKITGLTEKPEISVNGSTVSADDITLKGSVYSYNAPFETADISSDMSEYVLNAAKKYSNFFSKDLEGCYESTAPIADLFPEGSYYLEMAEQYRREDMWMFSAHESPVFSDEKVGAYTVYGEDFFSVEVSFKKSMVLKLGGETRIDDNHQIYYYVKKDGKWLIADMHDVQG